jgi:hypothetical protein
MSMAIPPAPQVPSVPGYVAGVIPAGYRNLKPSENNESVQQNAMRLWKELHNQPYGTTQEFEVDGQRYLARKEVHYHPPGFKSERKNWGPAGFHEGTTVYKAIDQSIQPTSINPQSSVEPNATGRSIFLQRISDLLDKLNNSI